MTKCKCTLKYTDFFKWPIKWLKKDKKETFLCLLQRACENTYFLLHTIEKASRCTWQLYQVAWCSIFSVSVSPDTAESWPLTLTTHRPSTGNHVSRFTHCLVLLVLLTWSHCIKYSCLLFCIYPNHELGRHTQHTVNKQCGQAHTNLEQWASCYSRVQGGSLAVDVGMGAQCLTTSPAHIFPTAWGSNRQAFGFKPRAVTLYLTGEYCT